MPEKALHAAASRFERTDGKARPDIKAARTLRSQKALVTGEAEHVDLHRLYVDRKNPRRLGCVHDEEQTSLMRHPAHACEIDEIAGEIRRVSADDRLRFRPDQPGNRVQIRHAFLPFPLKTDKGKMHSLILHRIKRTQHGIVLQHGGDHVIAGIQKAPDRGIQALRRVRCEGNPRRVFRMEELRQQTPAAVDRPGCRKRSAAGAAACISKLAERLRHRPDDGFRLSQRRGRAVKINHDSSPFRPCR